MQNGAYFGNYLNGIDAKNRLSIPAEYRDVIQQKTASRTVLIAEHESLPCLIGADAHYVNFLRQRRTATVGDQYDERREAMTVDMFALMERLEFDDSGRIVLDPDMRADVSIGNLAFFLGADEYFQIWDPYVLDSHIGQGNPRLARAIRRRLAAKGEPVPEALV